jgi:hypothetical protein
MSESSGEWILQELEHNERIFLVACACDRQTCFDIRRCRKNSFQSLSASNDRVVHDGLVGPVHEVALPTTAEFGRWPRVHLL